MPSIQLSKFSDFHKTDRSPGGAVYISRQVSVEFYGCIFLHCSSNAETTSSCRSNIWIGGGAIFADVLNGSISKCSFVSCSCPVLGSCFYICAEKSSCVDIECNSNVMCSSTKSASSIDRCIIHMRDDNSTLPSAQDVWSSLHIGFYPSFFDVRFCLVDRFTYGMSFTSEGSQQEISYLVFTNMIENGVAITVFYFPLLASNINMQNYTSGELVNLRSGGTFKIYDSKIGTLGTSSAVILKNVTAEEGEIFVGFKCKYENICPKLSFSKGQQIMIIFSLSLEIQETPYP